MKKYLNSVEEVVKALKEGKKIYDIECECYYYMEYNIIYGYYLKSKNIIMNDSIVFNNLEENPNFYTEEPEPLKFEVNRAYKVKCGEKVFIGNKLEKEKRYGVLSSKGLYFVDYDGKNVQGVDGFDIVGYWEEEK